MCSDPTIQPKQGHFSGPVLPTDERLAGDIVCERVAGRSALTRVWATDPLKLLTPRHPGNAAHATLSTYGGGLLGGDHVGVRVAVCDGASLVMTTQSAGKVYRTEDRPSVQSIDATVADNSLLAVLPDATCVFADGRFHQQQTYRLAAAGNLVWLDWLSSGRRARGERWQMTEAVTRATIKIDGVVRLRETLTLDGGPAAIGSLFRTGRFDCVAVLAMAGPQLIEAINAARAIVRDVPLSADAPLLAADASFSGGAIFRILGPDVQTVRAMIRRLIEPLDALLGHAPWGRKW